MLEVIELDPCVKALDAVDRSYCWTNCCQSHWLNCQTIGQLESKLETCLSAVCASAVGVFSLSTRFGQLTDDVFAEVKFTLTPDGRTISEGTRTMFVAKRCARFVTTRQAAAVASLVLWPPIDQPENDGGRHAAIVCTATRRRDEAKRAALRNSVV